MAYDDPKLPRSVLRGEQLFIGDDKEPYFRDPDAWIYLCVTDFSIRGGFESEISFGGPGPETPKPVRGSLKGKAVLEGKSSFAVAGMESGAEDSPIEFMLRPVPETETEFLWRAVIDHIHLWQQGQGETFWVFAYVPWDAYDTILAAVRMGQIDRMQIGLTTMMWTKDKAYSIGETWRKWHLALPTDRDDRHPQAERGTIVRITWDEMYGAKTTTPIEKDAAPSKPALVELPAKLYSVLSLITTLLVAMLALQLFRH